MTHISEADFTEIANCATAMHKRIETLEAALNNIWQLSLVAQAELDEDFPDESVAIEALIKIAEVAAGAVEPEAL